MSHNIEISEFAYQYQVTISLSSCTYFLCCCTYFEFYLIIKNISYIIPTYIPMFINRQKQQKRLGHSVTFCGNSLFLFIVTQVLFSCMLNNYKQLTRSKRRGSNSRVCEVEWPKKNIKFQPLQQNHHGIIMSNRHYYFHKLEVNLKSI